MTGHIKIFDPETGEVIVDKRNAIHYENMSQALANSLANKTTGYIHEMAFGNGDSCPDGTPRKARVAFECGEEEYTMAASVDRVPGWLSEFEEAKEGQRLWACYSPDIPSPNFPNQPTANRLQHLLACGVVSERRMKWAVR